MSQRTSTGASGLAAADGLTDAASSVAAASGVLNGTSASGASAGDAPTNVTSPVASASATSSRKLAAEGLLAAVVAFIIWGAFPVYLKPLHDVPPLQIIAHRIAWACVVVLVWLFARGELGDLRKPLTNPALLGKLTLTALLIAINWLAYVWGVAHGHVVETSLGYFISPLCNVLLGVVVLRERLNAAQWTAVGIATAAVLYLAIASGTTPWIALTVAVSFSTYGLIRKIVHVEALQGLAVETLALMPLALGYLLWCEFTGTGAFGHAGPFVTTLLVGCGAITAVPLFLFAFAARLIPYSTVGLLLYIAPSLQLLCGIFLYHEPFAGVRAQGFALIWLALVIYAGDGMWRARAAART
jgi:chloramphenicol-sensitive protein RarD